MDINQFIFGSGIYSDGFKNAAGQFIYGQEDDSQIRAKLVAVATQFKNAKGCIALGSEPQDWINFFNNPKNIQSIKEAFEKYGMPSGNRPSIGGKLFKKGKDFCDYGDIFRLYYHAKIAQDYPALNPNYKDNCYLIDGYLKGLETEKVAVEKEKAKTNNLDKYIRQMQVLNDKISDFNSLASNMLCKNYFKEQDSFIVEARNEKAREAAKKTQQEAYKAASETTTKQTNIALYVFGGAAVLIGIMFFASRKKA